VHINKDLAPIREKRAELLKDTDRIKDILKEGAGKARIIAQKTMQEVREAVY
jgi:tryptophanyl-tRNA synthetase